MMTPDMLSAESMMSTMTSLNETEQLYPLVKQPVHMIVVYTLTYGFVFVLGVIGNGLVVCVVFRTPSMNTVTNYFIVNLAFADLMVGMCCLPITLLTNIFSGWQLGAFMCKLTPFLQGVAVSASVNTLVAISIDRYLAICHVFQFRVTRKMARLVIALIWICAVVIMSPWAVFFQQVESHVSSSGRTTYVCDQLWPSDEQKRGYFLGVIVLTCYTVPLLFIIIFYTLIACKVWNRDAPGNSASSSQVIHRSKIRVLKMLIVVVILFAFCWLPLYAVNIRVYFGPPMAIPSLEFDLVTQTLIPLAQWLGLSSCSVNPVVYCLFSGKFRAGYRSLIVSKTCCRACAKEPQSPTQSSPSAVSTRFVTGGNRGFHNQIPLRDAPDSASPAIRLLGRAGYGSTKSATDGHAIAVNVIMTNMTVRETGGDNSQCKSTGGSRSFVRSRYEDSYHGQPPLHQQRQYLNDHCGSGVRVRRVQQTFI